MSNDLARERKSVLMVGTSIDTRGGIASVVATLRDNGLFERCGVDYVASHCDGSAARKAAQAASGWLQCITRLVTGKGRCLHVHLASHASFWRKLLFILPAYLLRVPVVLHLHGAEFHIFVDQECGVLGKWWVRWVFRRSSCAIVLSESWARWLRATVPGVNVRVIYNPVTLPAPSELVRDREAILFLGRLGERKGTFVLLDAASRLAKRGISFKLWLGGDGAIEAIRERASELGIADRVELLGWIGSERKSQLLAKAAIYCLPSYNEGPPPWPPIH